MSGFEFENDIDLGIEEKVKLPSLYKVILHNDDYTPMDFVVMILMDIFCKSEEEAVKIMMDVHKKGKGICGIYIYDIALTKSEQVKFTAEEMEYPLKCSIEEE